MLEQQQQQQQQQSYPSLTSAVLELAAAELEVLDVLNCLWLEGAASGSSSSRSWLSSSRELGNTALPAAQLAAALLAASMRSDDIRVAVNIAMHLCEGVHGETQAVSDSGPDGVRDDQKSLSPELQQLVQSTELLRLIAATHALHAQHLACLLCSSGSAGGCSSSSGGGSSSSGGPASGGKSKAVAAAAAAAAAWSNGPASSSATAQLLQGAGFWHVQQMLMPPSALAVVINKPVSSTEAALVQISEVLQEVWGII
jgi:hypothetical protein